VSDVRIDIEPFTRLQARLQAPRQRLMAHPVYAAVREVADLHVFLRHHVFAVWDFMSLLKALQRELTCLDEVWTPRGGGDARRFVNEIVVGEESDDVDGEHVSHFELYLRAMREAAAPTDEVDAVLADVQAGVDVLDALRSAPAAARAFSTTTFGIVRSGSLPRIAAAFTIGREDVIPDMFVQLVRTFDARGDASLQTLLRYLERHIELDGDEHGPMAARLLTEVCGGDPANWALAEEAARVALQARIDLWDGVLAAMPRGSAVPHDSNVR